ncbi:hypothetical protein OOU_Y34scaffold00528g64 [Pyricularia oryzae Y34]|uniref:Uncharacterized protein n=2 Tax=Pyricularia oryzae TaxID=318829 RepID=A0AA97NZ10_PYRO3|nr:hypothetical protein OOU_Y34scaffold00528g64 [Pyricularia oryzae Y34]
MSSLAGSRNPQIPVPDQRPPDRADDSAFGRSVRSPEAKGTKAK